GVHPDLVALPTLEARRGIPDSLLLDEHPRRPRPSGPRPQDGGEAGVAGAPRLLLREHRRRARERRGQPAYRARRRAAVLGPLDDVEVASRRAPREAGGRKARPYGTSGNEAPTMEA